MSRTLVPVRRQKVTILGPDGRPLSSGHQEYFTRDRVRATWDAAQTTNDNTRHWANADALSALAAASSGVRRILRNRARYEVANNSYANGIVLTLANYCIGTGPRLQLLLDDNAANRKIEAFFMDWARRVNLAAKLRTIRMARAQDGEAFATLIYNPKVDHPVKLDLALIEADRVAEPNALWEDKHNADGVLIDTFGNAVGYKVLKDHPGGNSLMHPTAYDTIRPQQMIHTFRIMRPGQHRGIPEIAPALPLFAQLRRYTLAVIAAAESAANIAGVIYTDGAADPETADEANPFETIELEKNLWTTLPFGYKMGQIRSEQPTTTYPDFKREILNEIARCVNMPYNIAACNSSGYNYASGRLDHQTFYVSLAVDRHDLDTNVCSPILDEWMREAILVEGLLPQSLRRIGATWPHRWMWPGFPHADPVKEATALAILLSNHAETLANHYAKDGRDWELEVLQRLEELKITGADAPQNGAATATAADDILRCLVREAITEGGTP